MSEKIQNLTTEMVTTMMNQEEVLEEDGAHLILSQSLMTAKSLTQVIMTSQVMNQDALTAPPVLTHLDHHHVLTDQQIEDDLQGSTSTGLRYRPLTYHEDGVHWDLQTCTTTWRTGSSTLE